MKSLFLGQTFEDEITKKASEYRPAGTILTSTAVSKDFRSSLRDVCFDDKCVAMICQLSTPVFASRLLQFLLSRIFNRLGSLLR